MASSDNLVHINIFQSGWWIGPWRKHDCHVRSMCSNRDIAMFTLVWVVSAQLKSILFIRWSYITFFINNREGGKVNISLGGLTQNKTTRYRNEGKRKLFILHPLFKTRPVILTAQFPWTWTPLSIFHLIWYIFELRPNVIWQLRTPSFYLCSGQPSNFGIMGLICHGAFLIPHLHNFLPKAVYSNKCRLVQQKNVDDVEHFRQGCKDSHRGYHTSFKLGFKHLSYISNEQAHSL